MNDDNSTRFTLRIDDKVLEEVKILAIRNKRSTAKQIEFILQQYVQSQSNPKG